MYREINDYLNSVKSAIDLLNTNEINSFINILVDAYERDKNIFILGNGGSASTASHFACDFNKGVSSGLYKRFRVIPLTDNIPVLTAYANDVNYDSVFVEQLRNFLQEGDVVIGISGSGNSKNVLKAIEYANHQNNVTVGITGFNGGGLKEIATYSVNTNVNSMQIAEDLHLIITHLTMTVLSNYIFSKEKVLSGEFR